MAAMSELKSVSSMNDGSSSSLDFLGKEDVRVLTEMRDRFTLSHEMPLCYLFAFGLSDKIDLLRKNPNLKQVTLPFKAIIKSTTKKITVKSKQILDSAESAFHAIVVSARQFKVFEEEGTLRFPSQSILTKEMMDAKGRELLDRLNDLLHQLPTINSNRKRVVETKVKVYNALGEECYPVMGDIRRIMNIFDLTFKDSNRCSLVERFIRVKEDVELQSKKTVNDIVRLINFYDLLFLSSVKKQSFHLKNPPIFQEVIKLLKAILEKPKTAKQKKKNREVIAEIKKLFFITINEYAHSNVVYRLDLGKAAKEDNPLTAQQWNVRCGLPAGEPVSQEIFCQYLREIILQGDLIDSTLAYLENLIDINIISPLLPHFLSKMNVKNRFFEGLKIFPDVLAPFTPMPLLGCFSIDFNQTVYEVTAPLRKEAHRLVMSIKEQLPDLVTHLSEGIEHYENVVWYSSTVLLFHKCSPLDVKIVALEEALEKVIAKLKNELIELLGDYQNQFSIKELSNVILYIYNIISQKTLSITLPIHFLQMANKIIKGEIVEITSINKLFAIPFFEGLDQILAGCLKEEAAVEPQGEANALPEVVNEVGEAPPPQPLLPLQVAQPQEVEKPDPIRFSRALKRRKVLELFQQLEIYKIQDGGHNNKHSDHIQYRDSKGSIYGLSHGGDLVSLRILKSFEPRLNALIGMNNELKEN